MTSSTCDCLPNFSHYAKQQPAVSRILHCAGNNTRCLHFMCADQYFRVCHVSTCPCHGYSTVLIAYSAHHVTKLLDVEPARSKMGDIRGFTVPVCSQPLAPTQPPILSGPEMFDLTSSRYTALLLPLSSPLGRSPTSSSFRVTGCSFRYASPCL